MRARPGRGLMTGLDARSLISQRIARPITLFLTLYVGVAVTIWVIESGLEGSKITTIQDALWWSLVTLSTVGYGDMSPETVQGKIFTFFVMTAGLINFSIVVSIVPKALPISVVLYPFLSSNPKVSSSFKTFFRASYRSNS